METMTSEMCCRFTWKNRFQKSKNEKAPIKLLQPLKSDTKNAHKLKQASKKKVTVEKYKI